MDWMGWIYLRSLVLKEHRQSDAKKKRRKEEEEEGNKVKCSSKWDWTQKSCPTFYPGGKTLLHSHIWNRGKLAFNPTLTLYLHNDVGFIVISPSTMVELLNKVDGSRWNRLTCKMSTADAVQCTTFCISLHISEVFFFIDISLF